jgi:hypothetical protein
MGPGTLGLRCSLGDGHHTAIDSGRTTRGKPFDHLDKLDDYLGEQASG